MVSAVLPLTYQFRGENLLYHNNGNGTFTEVAQLARGEAYYQFSGLVL